ncbi:MAG: hypothetical protein ACRDRR_03255 [Pseudonocardiaceae bacterium]
MSEPTSDALSGFDGTQAPEPLADPSTWSGHRSWGDVPELPPMWMPPVMDDTALREAIAAVLGDDADAPPQEVDQDPPAAPAPAPAPQAQPTGQPKAPDANVADVKVAAPPHSTTSAGPSAGVASGRHGTEAFGRSVPRPPPVSALIPPAPSHPRRPGGLRYRPPMAGASRESAPLTDLRRRIRRERVDLPLRSRSDGGATAVVLAILIIMVLLAYYVVTGFLDALSRLLP